MLLSFRMPTLVARKGCGDCVPFTSFSKRKTVFAAEAPRGVALAALLLPGPPVARLAFARALWAAGLARTLPAADAADAEAQPRKKGGSGSGRKK
jgi:hypothetical protein